MRLPAPPRWWVSRLWSLCHYENVEVLFALLDEDILAVEEGGCVNHIFGGGYLLLVDLEASHVAAQFALGGEYGGVGREEVGYGNAGVDEVAADVKCRDTLKNGEEGLLVHLAERLRRALAK